MSRKKFLEYLGMSELDDKRLGNRLFQCAKSTFSQKKAGYFQFNKSFLRLSQILENHGDAPLQRRGRQIKILIHVVRLKSRRLHWKKRALQPHEHVLGRHDERQLREPRPQRAQVADCRLFRQTNRNRLGVHCHRRLQVQRVPEESVFRRVEDLDEELGRDSGDFKILI